LSVAKTSWVWFNRDYVSKSIQNKYLGLLSKAMWTNLHVHSIYLNMIIRSKLCALVDITIFTVCE
jgi:hypothetical protein